MIDKVHNPQFRCSFCLEVLTNYWIPNSKNPAEGYWNSGRVWMVIEDPTIPITKRGCISWYTACSFCLAMSEELGKQNTIFDYFYTSLPTESFLTRDSAIKAFRSLCEHKLIGIFLKTNIYSWSALEEHLNISGNDAYYI